MWEMTSLYIAFIFYLQYSYFPFFFFLFFPFFFSVLLSLISSFLVCITFSLAIIIFNKISIICMYILTHIPLCIHTNTHWEVTPLSRNKHTPDWNQLLLTLKGNLKINLKSFRLLAEHIPGEVIKTRCSDQSCVS